MNERQTGPWNDPRPILDPEITRIHPVILNAMVTPLSIMSQYLQELEQRVGGKVHWDAALLPLTEAQTRKMTDVVMAVVSAAEAEATQNAPAGDLSGGLDERDQTLLMLLVGGMGRLFTSVQLSSIYYDESDPSQALHQAVDRINGKLQPLGSKIMTEVTFALVPDNFDISDESNDLLPPASERAPVAERFAGLWSELPKDVDPSVWQIHPALFNALLEPLGLLSRYYSRLEDRIGNLVNYEAVFRPLTDKEREQVMLASERLLDRDEQDSPTWTAGGLVTPLRRGNSSWDVLDLLAAEEGKLIPETLLAQFFAYADNPPASVQAAVEELNELLRPAGVTIITEPTYAIVPQTHVTPRPSKGEAPGGQGTSTDEVEF